ncbi:MAG: UDP-glucose/GDP-mannose dehydrogenase family protein, partial [Flavobacterium sp.]|nr:UDP-glucose/GDP-mannose dehydrogenase family protein [Flavobacterium sp.]
LEEYGIQVTIYDPWANPAEVMHEYNLTCHPKLPSCHSELVSESFDSQTKQSFGTIKYNAIVLGVAHKEFLNLDLVPLMQENTIVYDVKGILKNSDAKL